MPPAFKARLATIFCTLGLALSVYLALLKYFSLPCVGPGHCNTVIHSRYGSVLGLPVGVYGALLWSGAILVSDTTKRGLLLGMLAFGAVGFMCIQFLVLRGFCLYCTLHALMAFGAIATFRGTPARLSFVAGLALAAGGFYLTRQQVSSIAEASPKTALATVVLETGSALPWLGSIAPNSPALILSLNCPACLDLMETLEKQDFSNVRIGPALFFKVTDENRALTTEFVAAVLSQEGTRRDAFLAAVTLLLTQKDLALSSPETAAVQFASLFPAAAEHRPEATRILAGHTAELKRSQVGPTTPLLVSPEGKARAFFKLEELFPR